MIKYLISFKLLLSDLTMIPKTDFSATMIITSLDFCVINDTRIINVMPNEKTINHAIWIPYCNGGRIKQFRLYNNKINFKRSQSLF
jgi:hypothetical protein